MTCVDADWRRAFVTRPDTTALDAKIAACRAATGAYRDAFKLADTLTKELKAMGLCGHCAVSEHRWCRDYGCVCCGGGK